MRLKNILQDELRNIIAMVELDEFTQEDELKVVQGLIFKLHELESQLRIDIAGKRHENIQCHE